MDRALWQKTMCAAWLALGITAGLANADDTQPGKAKPAVPAPTPAVTSKDVVSAPATCESDKGRRPLQKLLHPFQSESSRSDRPQLQPDEVRVGCYSHYNDFSCGSLRADCRFIFGSCRSFFGERCIKAPPPFPVEGFDRNWLYPGGAPPESKRGGKLFGGGGAGCSSCGW